MATVWGLDLGTTNSVLSMWDQERAEPRLLPLPEISRSMGLTETPVIPSAIYLYHGNDWRSQLGRWPFVERRWLLGRQAHIGRVALEMTWDGPSKNYVESFKPLLGREATRIMTRANGKAWSAREVTRIYIRELLRAAHENYHEKIRDLTVTVPVDAFETYRAELRDILERLGVRRIQMVDEPVAAALGYGLNTERELNLLVFDFGGGTLHCAVVRTTGPGKAGTPAEVVAKQGLNLGGNNVDVWLLEHFARQAGIDPALWRGTEWYQALLDGCQELKESLYSQEVCQLTLQDRVMIELGMRGKDRPELSRDQLIELLREHGLYSDMQRTIELALAEAATKGVAKEDIDEVIVVGGSSLLPEVHTLLEELFGRGSLRDWLPFEAVAYGSVVFASGHKVQDFIRHDYALLIFDRESKQPEYPVIIPRGTPYPTEPIIWEDYFHPTCPRGEPAAEFELRICELARAAGAQKEIVFDENSRLRVLDRRSDEPVIVCLNEADPTLGKLKPPYSPDRRDARLHIGFGVNGDRYLVATVRDLDNNTLLMDRQAVVKLR